MATRNKRINAASKTTIPARNAHAIAADIVAGLKGLGAAKKEIGKVYQEAAETLHAISQTFTDLQWNRCKSEESTKAAYVAAGMDAATFAKVAEFRKTILDAVKEFNEAEAKTVWQNICRWSPGFTGSKPNHPNAIKAAKAGTKAKAETGTKAKAEPEAEDIAKSVCSDPQRARILISKVIAGLNENKALKVKNKISVSNISAAIDALGEAMEYIALMKTK